MLRPAVIALVASFAFACGGGVQPLQIGVMPNGGSYNGVFQSPQYGEMHLCQTGTQVVGDYVKNERQGRIQGTVHGDVLRFTWEEARSMVVGRTQTTRGRGYFRLSLDENEDFRFDGEWGYDDTERGSPWTGVRLRNREPSRCNGASGGEDTDDLGGDDDYDDPSAQDDYDGHIEGLD